ncbi:MAG: type II toxin-antitoxin system HicA family toxin [Erysipelotrichaceae bacterium]|nr:type II toxin-antitoxin system HicA family toxin [Erysipelotrichaceae bacterium]
MPMTPKEMVRFLKKHGFVRTPGGKGSHWKYYNPKTGRSTTVPYHNRSMSIGTEQATLRQAGLKK